MKKIIIITTGLLFAVNADAQCQNYGGRGNSGGLSPYGQMPMQQIRGQQQMCGFNRFGQMPMQQMGGSTRTAKCPPEWVSNSKCVASTVPAKCRCKTGAGAIPNAKCRSSSSNTNSSPRLGFSPSNSAEGSTDTVPSVKPSRRTASRCSAAGCPSDAN